VLTLLIIGIYFLLQVSPLIINKKLLEHSEVQQHHDQGEVKLTNVVHPLVIGIALILFLSYLIKLFIEWDGSVNTQLLQMVIFSCVNTFLVVILVFIYRKIKRTSGKERQELKVGFSKSAPLFIYLSIGISIYHFAKMLIFDFELNEFRPAMMSIALLAVGFAVFTTVMPNNHMLVNSQEE
jgi:predicted membrane channel-forming protein YqfA (hemolysin III family)